MTRSEISQRLTSAIRAHGETRAARLVAWGRAYQDAIARGESVTGAKNQADAMCANLDAESAKLHGEIEALRIEREEALT